MAITVKIQKRIIPLLVSELRKAREGASGNDPRSIVNGLYQSGDGNAGHVALMTTLGLSNNQVTAAEFADCVNEAFRQI